MESPGQFGTVLFSQWLACFAGQPAKAKFAFSKPKCLEFAGGGISGGL